MAGLMADLYLHPDDFAAVAQFINAKIDHIEVPFSNGLVEHSFRIHVAEGSVAVGSSALILKMRPLAPSKLLEVLAEVARQYLRGEIRQGAPCPS